MLKGPEKEVNRTDTHERTPTSRDIRPVKNILSILDTTPIKTTPFGSNYSAESAYRRAERLAAALNLLTAHVPESEPLRRSLRTGALELLRAILNVRSTMRATHAEGNDSLFATIRELISGVRLLTVAGYLSSQNALILIEAMDGLGSLISSSANSLLGEHFSLDSSDFHTSSTVSAPVRRDADRAPRIQKDNGTKDTVVDTTDRARAQQILEILGTGGILGIKDISANLPQYSEKMIQRELAELVRLSRVHKTGAKRWSRYRLRS